MFWLRMKRHQATRKVSPSSKRWRVRWGYGLSFTGIITFAIARRQKMACKYKVWVQLGAWGWMAARGGVVNQIAGWVGHQMAGCTYRELSNADN
jgi:hypothetical protein